MDMTQKRKLRIVILGVVGFLLLWFGALHGEYRSSRYRDGLRYTSTQYVFGFVLWQTRGSDPRGLPFPPPDRNAVLGEARFWRGFGLVIKWRRRFR
jgi:hypothetical protein